MTGNSGGGTMTTWLCGVEPRWTMAAPSCFVTTFRRNLENELPQDTEQCPPRALALGLDHADFLAAMAPKPIIILAKERDYFDVPGRKRPISGCSGCIACWMRGRDCVVRRPDWTWLLAGKSRSHVLLVQPSHRQVG